MPKNNNAVRVFNTNPNWEKDGERYSKFVSAWDALVNKESYKLDRYTWTEALRWGLADGDIDSLYEQTLYRYIRRYGGELSRKQCKQFNSLWEEKHGKFHSFSGKGSRRILDSTSQYEALGACITWDFEANEPYWFVSHLHADRYTSVKNPNSMARNECELTDSLINKLKKEIEHEQRLSYTHRRIAQQAASSNGATSCQKDGHGHGQGNGAPREFNQRVGPYRIFYLENGANAWQNDGLTWQSEIEHGRRLEFFPAKDGSLVALSYPMVSDQSSK